MRRRFQFWFCGFIGGFIYNTYRLGLHKNRPCYSTGIHGGTTCGYGELSHNGYWQFPVRSLEN